MKKQLLAPNGKPSNLTSEQYKLVRTPAFKKWFGDWENDPENSSKVIDEETKEPLLVYHGTTKNFTIFDKKYSTKNTKVLHGYLGFFFTTDFDLAIDFTRKDWTNRESKHKSNWFYAMKCFLNIRKPKIITARGFTMMGTTKKTQDMLLEYGFDGMIIEKYTTQDRESWKNIFGERGIKEFDYNQYVAFKPNQIKLADGTNTTFDSNNFDIRFYNGGETSIPNIFWGKVAGGVLIYSKKTDRFLLLKRSEYVLEPNTWGIISGKLDADENIEEAVIRETKEETGFQLKSIIPAYVFKSNGFTFHNFVSIIDDEFIPVLNWENTEYGWFKLNEFPKNLHFGLELLIKNTDLKDLTNKYSDGGEINNTNIFSQIWGWFGIKF